VRAIEQDASGVVVQTSKGAFRAARAVMALPPAVACKIDGLADRAKLMARLPMGSVIKCIASYDRAFWREAGYSGEAFSTTGAIRATFDDCSPSGDHAALVAFIVGDAAKQLRGLADAARKQRVIEELVLLHGPLAGTPRAYVDKDWQTDEWTTGCYVGVMPPGVVREVGTKLREPFGRVHVAGTETAVHHVGYIEGAIESGERAAREILECGDLAPSVTRS
jgi:monoamine oxidase